MAIVSFTGHVSGGKVQICGCKKKGGVLYHIFYQVDNINKVAFVVHLVTQMNGRNYVKLYEVW